MSSSNNNRGDDVVSYYQNNSSTSSSSMPYEVTGSDERIMNDSTMPPPKSKLIMNNDTKLMPPLSSPTKLNHTSSSSNTTEHIDSIKGMSISSTTTASTHRITSQPQPPQQKQQQPVRKKVGRFGLSDWTRLLSVSKDLAQLHGKAIRNNIQWNEIKLHNNIHDGWTVIKNKVYNITPYIRYHPGGEKILKPTLGNDGTILFNKYHRWVNEDGYV